MEHNLKKYFQKGNGNDMNYDEFVEFDKLVNFDNFLDGDFYEYNGQHIISKDSFVVSCAVDNMCCGIVDTSIKLSNGETVYFAFDYGH